MLKQDLNFRLEDSNKTLTLKPIPPLLLQRFVLEWRKTHPKPVPPPREMTIGDEVVAVPNSTDQYFVMLLEDWAEEKNAAEVDFFLAYGVVDSPPDDWEPDPLFYSGDRPPQWKRKALWLSEILQTLDDMNRLTEAIQSLNMITERGLEEAKNGSALPQEEAISSNGR